MSKTMKYTLVFLAFYWAFMIYAPMANSAEIKVEGNKIYLSGDIKPGDDLRLADVISPGMELILSSNGGYLRVGISLGHMVKSFQLTTTIQDGNKCYSACGLVFMSGVKKNLDGTLGIHCARLQGTKECYKPGTEKMLAFVKEVSPEYHNWYSKHAWQVKSKLFTSKTGKL